ncbi:MAG: phosphoglycerate dehydrogenase, partial [Dehalococcoidaceae bacterium]|nr:phosphoglycerate dehydrogenase [Dehalococcoidaceae bacterium]
MSIKILITDPISEKGLSLLKKNNMEIIYKPELSSNELLKISKNVDGWIIRSGTKISKEHIANSKKLQIIGRAGVGVDNIDIDSATSKGIIVMNVPDGNTVSAAEHTIAMMLSLSRNIQLGHLSLSSGTWDRHKLTGSELQEKILGVVGLGKIGREVIKRALSFDMKILGYDPYVSQELFDPKEVEVVSLDELTKRSDYITLHVPLNKATKNLFNLDRLKMMKSSARIINVARGGIINEEDIAYALNNEIISGAAIDVFVTEPLDKGSSLLKTKNIL